MTTRQSQYTCLSVDGSLVDYYHTPFRPRLGRQILLQDRRRHDRPWIEFEIVCIQDREITVEEIEGG